MAEIGIRVVVAGVAEARRSLGNVQTDVNALSRAIAGVSGTTSALGTNLQSVGNALIGVGRTITVGVTVPILAAGAAAITAGIEFEAAFAGIGKTVDGVMDSTGQLTDLGEQIRQEFRDMALEIPIATNELAALGEVVGQLGIRAEDVAEVTEIIAMLGATTELAAEDAARGLIRFGNIMGVAADDISDFLLSAGSAVVALGNASVSTEGEILNLTLRLAAAGDRANFTAPQILAWATTLSDLGVRAEMGGSAVSRAINEMLFAVQSGSDNLETFAAVTGQTVDQFVQAFEEDASTALSRFISQLEEGIRTGEVTKDMLNELGLSGVRSIDVLGRLGDAEAIFAKNLAIANMAWEEQLALQEEFNKRSATVEAQIQLLKNAFTDLGITIFDLVREDITDLLLGIRELVNKFKNLDPEIQKTIIKIALFAAAIGPVLIVLGGLIAGLGLFVSGIVALLSPAGLATAAVLGLTAALGAIAIPSLAGILGDLDSIKAAALEVGRVLGFVVTTSPTPEQEQAGEHAGQGPAEPTTSFQIPTFDTFLQGLKDLGGPDVENAINSISRIGASFSRIFETISNNPKVQKSLRGLAENFGKIGESLKDLSLGALNSIARFLEENEDRIAEGASTLLTFADALQTLAAGFLDVSAEIAGGGLDVVLSLVSALADLVNGDFEGALGNLKVALGEVIVAGLGAGEAIKEAGHSLAETLAGEEMPTMVESWSGNLENLQVIFDTWWTNFSSSWSGNWDNIKLIVTTVWDNIKKAVESKTGELSSGIEGWWAGFTGSWSGNWDQAKTIVSTAWDSIKKSVESKLGDIKSIIDSITSSITTGIQSAADSVKGPIDSIAGQLETASDAFGDLGGAAQGAAGAVQGAADKMIAAMEAVLGAITGSPELAIQHPFEDFNAFLKETPFDFGINFSQETANLTAALSSANMPASSIVNNSSATNFNFGSITGVPMSSEESLAATLEDRLRMANF